MYSNDWAFGGQCVSIELYNAWNAIERYGSPKHSCCKTFFVRYSWAKHATSNVTQLEIKILGSYSNILVYPTRCNFTLFILSGNCSTCFRWYHHPSSGAQTTVSTASVISHTWRTPPTAHSNQFQLFHDSGR